jgi:hypothetical protein
MNFGAEKSVVVGIGTFCSDLPVKIKTGCSKVLVQK